MKSRSGVRWTWALMVPSLLLILALSIYPLARGVSLGFADYALGSDTPRWSGLENYRYMLTDRHFIESFRVGGIWTVTVTLGQMLLGLGLALLLNANLPIQGLARVLVLIPWAMPPVIKGMVWRIFFHPTAGVFNRILISLGVIAYPINWLNDYALALPAAIVVGIWTGLPLTAVTLLAGLQTIPGELKEASSLDGASPWQHLWKVTLPLMMPIVVSTSALRVMWNFNSFGLIYALTEGGPAGRTRPPMLFAYEEAFRYGNFGYSAALGNVMVLAMAIILIPYVRNEYLKSTDK